MATQGAHLDDDTLTGKVVDRRLMRRLLAYLRPYGWNVVLALFLLFCAFALELAQPYLVKVAIDDHIARGDARGVGGVALLYLATLVGVLSFRYLELVVMHYTGQRLMLDLRMQIFRHLMKLHVRFFHRNPVGRLMTRVTGDVDVLNEMFTSGVVSILEDLLKLSGIVVVLLVLDWKLALTTFLVLPLIMWAAGLFRARVRHTFRLIRERLARINAFLQENLSGIRVVQLFNHEEPNEQRFARLNGSHLEAHLKTVFYFAVFFPVIELIGAVALALIVWHGGLRVLGGELTFGILVAFTQYAQQFFRPISDLSEKYGVMQNAMASSERIFKLLDTEELAPGAPAVTPPAHLAGRIAFENVWFSYVESEPVLRDVTFTIEPGERVAVVGATGAGKTTLVNLITRLYDVDRGRILIDGHDIRTLPADWLRRRIGAVQQDVFLFAGPVADNITLGRDAIGEQAIQDAARQVGAHEFIAELGEGYATEVHEGGTSLSVGQKQLLAFARTLAHDPTILVLDEATSSVDTETEALIQGGLDRLLRERTALVIAHRLSTIKAADRILVMHKGRIREQGTHADLLAAGGIYRKLYELQYRDQEDNERVTA